MRERELDECLRSAHAQAQDMRRTRKGEGNVAWHVPLGGRAQRGTLGLHPGWSGIAILFT